MNKLAVFELGVNDISLTIFKYTNNGFFAPEQQIKEPVKLTQDMERDGYIKPARIQETIAILKNYRKIIDALKIENMICYQFLLDLLSSLISMLICLDYIHNYILILKFRIFLLFLLPNVYIQML